MLNILKLKDIDKYDLDDPRRTLEHKKIIEQKPFLKRLYVEWYSEIRSRLKDVPEGKIIELGSGGGFMKEVIPGITTSDILELDENDITFNALDMPFEDNSIAAFVMVDVFHHVPDSEMFLKEMNRCLKPGGKVVMSEPAVSAYSKFIFGNFHHEPFNVKGDWTIPGTGPMSDANGALPWIVFVRDRKRFQDTFPLLHVVDIKKHTALRYLLSGGVSMKQLVPSWSYNLLKGIENMVQSIFPGFSLFQFIELKKVSTDN